ncbi:MAG: hypothetical protein JKY99_04605 [Rhizobiales bacterium]|nr:hypothetical protein [Hyphomicrobiales bacterium]
MAEPKDYIAMSSEADVTDSELNNRFKKFIWWTIWQPTLAGVLLIISLIPELEILFLFGTLLATHWGATVLQMKYDKNFRDQTLDRWEF